MSSKMDFNIKRQIRILYQVVVCFDLELKDHIKERIDKSLIYQTFLSNLSVSTGTKFLLLSSQRFKSLIISIRLFLSLYLEDPPFE